MSNAENMRWFHREFADKVRQATAGTLFSPDLVMAIALKETGSYIRRMRADDLPTEDILYRCVGDTIERADDVIPAGEQNRNRANPPDPLWVVAREALEAIADYSSSYRSVADRRKDAFCRGFGIFQYDIQFFPNDRRFFLEREWRDFNACLSRFMNELRAALRKNGWANRNTLTFEEQVGVGIAYNNGPYKPEKNFRQGHRNAESGRYYGEELFDILKEAQGLSLDWSGAAARGPAPATKAKLLQEARREWESWGRSSWNLVANQIAIAQTDQTLERAQYIIDRYLTPLHAKATLAQIQGDGYAWSAVGMSYFHRSAGYTEAQFPFSQSHSKFIRHFIAARNNNRPALYHGYRVSEESPDVGDLICYLREGRTFEDSQEFFDNTERYDSHSDLVVARRAAEIDVIGANVRKSVTMKTLALDEHGLIADRNFQWFAVLKSQT